MSDSRKQQPAQKPAVDPLVAAVARADEIRLHARHVAEGLACTENGTAGPYLFSGPSMTRLAGSEVHFGEAVDVPDGSPLPPARQQSLGFWKKLTPEEAAGVVTLQQFRRARELQEPIRAASNLVGAFGPKLADIKTQREALDRLEKAYIEARSEQEDRQIVAEAALADFLDQAGAGRPPEWKTAILAGRPLVKEKRGPKTPLDELADAYRRGEVAPHELAPLIGLVNSGRSFTEAVTQHRKSRGKTAPAIVGR